jgi:hypothetical protein
VIASFGGSRERSHPPAETTLATTSTGCKVGFRGTARSEVEAPEDENADGAETVRRDLDRIVNTGGVPALVGSTYGAAKDVGVYVTGEAIRGLADLEAK